VTPIPASYDELQREVMDLRMIVEDHERRMREWSASYAAMAREIVKLERAAEAKARTAHYPAVRPLREPTYRTLGNRLEQDDDGA
jgi:ADP-ribose pyrophosphatase YjhB (NUDIX family)